MLLKYLKKIIYIVLGIFLVFFITKKYLYYSTPTTIQFPTNFTFKDGDIILRKESNSISDIFAKINNMKYSHIGVILFQEQKLKIVHIEDNEKENDFKISEFKDFITYASSYAVYRPKESVNRKKLSSLVEKIAKSNPEFDMDFSSNERDNKLYCTELAFKLHNISVENKLEKVVDKYLQYSFIPLRIFTDKSRFTLVYASSDEKVN